MKPCCSLFFAPLFHGGRINERVFEFYFFSCNIFTVTCPLAHELPFPLDEDKEDHAKEVEDGQDGHEETGANGRDDGLPN